MNISKNKTGSIKLISKNKIILLGFISMIFIILITLILNISSFAENMMKDYKSALVTKIVIGIDLTKIDFENIEADSIPEKISIQEYLNYSQSKYLEGFLMQGQVYASLDKLKAVDGEIADDIIVFSMLEDEIPNQMKPTINIIAYSNIDKIKEFLEGSRTLVKGKFPNEKFECIISEEFAAENKIDINDNFEIVNSKNIFEKGNLKIVGIYEDKLDTYLENFDIFKSPELNRRNEVITKFETLQSVISDEYITTDAEYELKNLAYLKSFESEIRQKGLDFRYSIITSDELYDELISPIFNIFKISQYGIIVTVIIALIFLVIIIMFILKNREKQVYIMQIKGIKKTSIITELAKKIVIVVVISNLIGFGISYQIINQYGNDIWNQQIEKYNQNMENEYFNDTFIIEADGREFLSEIDLLLKSEFKFDSKNIYLLMIFTFLELILISILIIIKIMRQELIKIIYKKK